MTARPLATVNSGQPRLLRSIETVSSAALMAVQPYTFQAGHAGSIPVARSNPKTQLKTGAAQAWQSHQEAVSFRRARYVPLPCQFDQRLNAHHGQPDSPQPDSPLSAELIRSRYSRAAPAAPLARRAPLCLGRPAAHAGPQAQARLINSAHASIDPWQRLTPRRICGRSASGGNPTTTSPASCAIRCSPRPPLRWSQWTPSPLGARRPSSAVTPRLRPRELTVAISQACGQRRMLPRLHRTSAGSGWCPATG